MKVQDQKASPMRRLIAALAGVLVCATLCLAQAEQPKVLVEDVIPQGNRSVPTQKIISLIKTRPGAEYKDEIIQEDVRRLTETRLFQNIKVIKQESEKDKTKVNVYFIVAEFPTTVQEIVYQGLKHHFKKDELDAIAGIRKGTPLNPIANRIAREAIERAYHAQGYLWASVDLLEGDKPGDARVVFNITEGRVAKVAKISIEGNPQFVSELRLKTQIDSSHMFLQLLGGTYDPEKVSRDVTHLEEYYKSFGFLDVKVAREIQWADDFQKLHLIFHVREGPRYRVNRIEMSGNKVFTQDELQAPLKLRVGDFYDKNKVEADLAIQQAKYGWTGRTVTVREELFRPDLDAPAEVAVHYEIQERPPAKVGNVYVVGNEWTKQNVILRQVPLYPGQLLTWPDLKVAEANLARLHIFDPAPDVKPTVSVLDIDSDTEFKDVLVRVKETPTGTLMFGVGVNSDAGLQGTISLNERNFDICRPPTSFEDLLSGHAFRGAGQELNIQAVPGTQVQRYSITFREPQLFDSLYSLGLSAYYWQHIYNEDTESRLGTKVSIGRRLNQYWQVIGAVRVEDVGVHNVPFYEPIDYQQAEGQHLLVGLKGTVQRDARDSYLRPTSGSLISASFEQITGDYTFPQITAEASQYFTLHQRADGSGKHVLGLRSQLGYSGSHTPVFERFFAGGFASMRGFEFRGVGPAVNTFMVGGDFEWLNSIEYQYPILANDNLYGVVFVDSGTVETDVAIRNYRVAAGFGLRIVVPMMGPLPIALDFGFPIVKAPEDRDQVFSFWVGFFH
jgi:outer membrane protein assembly complex protein YaeT